MVLVQEWASRPMEQKEELEIDSNLWAYGRKYMNIWEKWCHKSKGKHKPFNKLFYGNWFPI